MQASQTTASVRLSRPIKEMAVLAEARTEATIKREPRLSLGFAISTDDVVAAQRLRHRVFVDELGASPTAHSPGREHDMFDPWCEHLVVRDRSCGSVVGTYRMLTAERALRLGTFCAEREFDLTRLGPLRPQLAEVGRACVDPAYRTGATLVLLWSGIARLARERGATHLIGCASISMADGGTHAAAVYRHLAPRHLAPVEYRVFPRSPLAALEQPTTATSTIPPLINGYLQLGAWIGGEPAWDPEFNTADLLMILPLARLATRYARHFRQERRAA